MDADECTAHESSDESDDYEPVPIGKVLEDHPPPIPPPRGMTFSSNSPPTGQQTVSLRHESLCHTVRTSISVDLKILRPEGVVQLSEFITRYSALLPCQVKVLEDSPSVPTQSPSDRIINLHFIKHAKVVVVTDTSSDKKLSVPLNSTAKFSIIYDPSSDLDEAMNGYQFDSVKEMLSKKPLPLIVQATRSFQGNTTLSSVENGEILLIRGIKTFLRNKQLRVQNLKGETKQLSEKCSGSFTTDPEQLSLSLSQLLKLDISLPVRAVVYDKTAGKRSVVVLERIAGETYLIASYPNWLHKEYFELSSDVTIKVEPVELDSGSRQELIRATHTLFHSFSSSAMPVVWESEDSEGLYGQLMPGREQEGVQLVRPISIDRVFPTPESAVEVDVPSEGIEDEVTADDDGIYAVLNCVSHDGKSEDNTGQDLVSGQDTISSAGSKGSMPSNKDAYSSLNDSLKSLATRVEQLSSTVCQQQTAVLHELHRLQSIVLDLQKEVQSLTLNQPLLDESFEENRRVLATLDCNQVNTAI